MSSQRRYDDLSKEQLIALLKARDERRFGLIWENDESVVPADRSRHTDFVALQHDPSLSTVSPTFQNLLIEADNFDALRALRMTHKGRIKCILIDPPYNTGNKDFIYNDRFVGSEDSWRHSTWLEYMSQRLTLARDLLTADGVIFVHIGEDEVDHLGCLMDQVFPGQKVGKFVWKTRTGSNADTEHFFTHDHEYILCYARSGFAFGGIVKDTSNYTNPNNDKRGAWTTGDLTLGFNYAQRPNLFYPLQNPANGFWYPSNPKRVWVYASERFLKKGQKVRTKTMEQFIAEDKVIFPTNDRSVTYLNVEQLHHAIEEGSAPANLRSNLYEDPAQNEAYLTTWVGRPIGYGSPQFKRHLADLKRSVKPLSSWIRNASDSKDEAEDSEDETKGNSLVSSMTKEGTRELQQMLPENVFGYPKPRSVIQGLLSQATGPDDIILDFFAGSGTTGHAVLALNAEDGGNRRFILVSSTEASREEPVKNVCRDVARLRLLRAIQGYEFRTKTLVKRVEGLPGDFAYLRTVRIPPGRVLTRLTHDQIWTSLQLIHLGQFEPAPTSSLLWQVDDGQETLVYLPRANGETLSALEGLRPTTAKVTLYAWQPHLVAQHAPAGSVVRAVPQTLFERFGLKP